MGCRFVCLLIWASAATICWPLPALAQALPAPTTLPVESLDRATIVVVGKLQVMEPLSPSQGRTLYAVRVEQTLKGHDETGFTMWVGDQTLSELGERRIFPHNQHASQFVSSPTGPSIPATADAIAATVRTLKERNAQVLPKRLIWAQKLPGSPFGDAIRIELEVFEDLAFRWSSSSRMSRANGTAQRVEGRVSREALMAMMDVMAPVSNDDVGGDSPVTTLRWADLKGDIQTRRCVGDEAFMWRLFELTQQKEKPAE
jgi:hypothetical protein